MYGGLYDVIISSLALVLLECGKSSKVQMGKCRSGKLSGGKMSGWGFVAVRNCPGGKISLWEIVTWDVVRWEIVGWEIVGTPFY